MGDFSRQRDKGIRSSVTVNFKQDGEQLDKEFVRQECSEGVASFDDMFVCLNTLRRLAWYSLVCCASTAYEGVWTCKCS